MRVWRWNVTIERARSSPKKRPPVVTDPVLRDILLAFPRGSVVRNVRTGENVGISLYHLGEITRGLGVVAAQPCDLSDEWILLAENKRVANA